MGVRFGTPSAALVLSCLLVLLTACGGLGRVSRDGTTCTGELTGPGPVYLTAWFHTGTPAEAATMRRQVAAFNAAQRQVQVRLTEIPGGRREWFSYGFAPVIWSAGGDLINRSGYRTAQGVLNSPASVRALSSVQSWFRAGLVNPNPDGTAFGCGQAVISWGGSWMCGGYHLAVGNDLKIVPLPRFGARPSSGLGSWQWGITSNAADGDAAWRFLSYLLQTSQVLRLARASGGIPATRAAIRQVPAFAPGGPEHLYVQQLEDGIARARPQTPAYPAITAAFSAAFLDITRGGNVRRALDTAAGQIDRNLAAHRYYQPSEP